MQLREAGGERGSRKLGDSFEIGNGTHARLRKLEKVPSAGTRAFSSPPIRFQPNDMRTQVAQSRHANPTRLGGGGAGRGPLRVPQTQMRIGVSARSLVGPKLGHCATLWALDTTPSAPISNLCRRPTSFLPGNATVNSTRSPLFFTLFAQTARIAQPVGRNRCSIAPRELQGQCAILKGGLSRD